jgi:glutathione S-transferase
MKLYYSPGACSLSPHIALREAGLSFSLEKVDLRTKALASGGDFRSLSPKGYVPALQLEDGALLTEGPAIVQYIADQAPQSGLAPAAGTMQRYRLIEWLTYINSELHKAFSPLFNPATSDDAKEAYRAALAKKFDFVSQSLGERAYLLGDAFSVADAYLFTVLRWCHYVGVNLEQWPVLKAFFERVASRPMVHAAMVAEGLIKTAPQH